MSIEIVIFILALVTIMLSGASLIISAWRTGGMKHDLRVMKRNARKIAWRIRKDISLAIHNN